MTNPLRLPVLSRGRIALAFSLALAADAAQLALGPMGWVFLDEMIDIFTMVIMTFLLGFHPLFLPTFIIELIPVADMLPTWTGCVGAVILFRKRHGSPPRTPPGDPRAPVIDV